MENDTDTDSDTDRGGLVVLSREECLALLRQTPIGRLAFLAGDSVTVLPVTFALDGDAIVFRTRQGAKLGAAASGQRVAFEIDHWNQQRRDGWSVLVRGPAELVTDEQEVERLLSASLTPWAKRVERPLFVRISPEELSGRRIPSD